MVIGIDIGGSNIKGVLLNNDKIVAKIKIPTRSKTNQKIIIGQIFKCIQNLINKGKDIKGIGIGVAGPVDINNQIVLNPPNVVGLKNLKLGELIEEKFKIKTVIDNDVHCLALAEAIRGAGKGKNLVVGLGLGTGVGGGIVINKKIVYGKSGTAGEMGHMMIDRYGRRCGCGARGCLETYINEKGIQKNSREFFGKRIDSISLRLMARKGNSKAIEVWKITGGYLGLGLANIVDNLNPDIIVIGGGIANAGELLLNSAKKEMRKNVLSPLAKKTPVILSKLGEYAGAIGASLL